MIPPEILTALLVLAMILPPGWLVYRKLCPVKRAAEGDGRPID